MSAHADDGAPEQVTAYLVEAGLSTIRLFSYLAAGEAELVEMVAKPTGPDDVPSQVRFRRRSALQSCTFLSYERIPKSHSDLRRGVATPGGPIGLLIQQGGSVFEALSLRCQFLVILLTSLLYRWGFRGWVGIFCKISFPHRAGCCLRSCVCFPRGSARGRAILFVC